MPDRAEKGLTRGVSWSERARARRGQRLGTMAPPLPSRSLSRRDASWVSHRRASASPSTPDPSAFAKCEVEVCSGQRPSGQGAKLAARYNVSLRRSTTTRNSDTLKDNPEVDVVYVVLPNSMHAEYTIRALKAGKHVLCEKPMANTPADCQAMIDAAKQAGRKLMVAYRCRYEPYNQEMIRMAREQELGPVKVIVADHGFSIGDPTQWRLKKDMAGGGSMMDIGI